MLAFGKRVEPLGTEGLKLQGCWLRPQSPITSSLYAQGLFVLAA